MTRWTWFFLAIVTLLIAPARSPAQDKIVTRDREYVGRVTRTLSDGSPMIKLASGEETKVNRDTILSIEMEEPAELKKARAAFEAADFQGVLDAVESKAKAFQGLPASWVIEALGLIGDALIELGQKDKARSFFETLTKSYANTDYANKATVGLARLAIDESKFAEAESLLQPIVKQATSEVDVEGPRSELYGAALFAWGELLEARRNEPQALEAFLLVVHLHNANPSLVEQANRRALALQQKSVYVR